MLSRIARGLYDLGSQVERVQHVVRIFEVTHKMNLERAGLDERSVWTAISESFAVGIDGPTEGALYREFVLSETHPYSVLRCIGTARDEGRAMREHISEEMWVHLNRSYLELSQLSFEAILQIGRSEFNRQIEVFADAFSGLADDTMIRGESWSFLRLGKLTERAAMICRILGIKHHSLALAPAPQGAPVDVHQWQGLLRSLSGYEPYRRAYDARIEPSRVLDFVLKRHDFPRSLTCTLRDLRRALDGVYGSNAVQLQLGREIDGLIEELRRVDATDLMSSDRFESELNGWNRGCERIARQIELGFFTSWRPASQPVVALPGYGLVSQ